MVVVEEDYGKKTHGSTFAKVNCEDSQFVVFLCSKTEVLLMHHVVYYQVICMPAKNKQTNKQNFHTHTHTQLGQQLASLLCVTQPESTFLNV